MINNSTTPRHPPSLRRRVEELTDTTGTLLNQARTLLAHVRRRSDTPDQLASARLMELSDSDVSQADSESTSSLEGNLQHEQTTDPQATLLRMRTEVDSARTLLKELQGIDQPKNHGYLWHIKPRLAIRHELDDLLESARQAFDQIDAIKIQSPQAWQEASGLKATMEELVRTAQSVQD